MPGITILYDAKGGVSGNQAINYEGKDVTLADALDGMFKKNGLGYYIRSGAKDAYDGSPSGSSRAKNAASLSRRLRRRTNPPINQKTSQRTSDLPVGYVRRRADVAHSPTYEVLKEPRTQ